VGQVKAEGQCRPGGPLEAVHVPLPAGVVKHAPPRTVTPRPLPALPHGTRDYQRAWGISHGFHVATVGALPRAVLQAYQEALRDD
jgi:hypothetical protein